MRRIIFSLLLVILSLTSCIKPENAKEFEIALELIFPELKNENTRFVVIIPSQGCGGCITSVEDFYNNNRSENSIKWVFTNIISLKMLGQKVKINETNTYLDIDNDVFKAYPSSKKIYPCVIELENNKIINIFYQSPDENALRVIEQYYNSF